MFKKLITLLLLHLSLCVLQANAQDLNQLSIRVKRSPDLLLKKDFQQQLISRSDSLFKLRMYPEMVIFLTTMDSLYQEKYIRENPIFKAKLIFQKTKALARQGDVSSVYDHLKKAEVYLTNSRASKSELSLDIYNLLSITSRRLGYYEEALKYSHLILPLMDEIKEPLKVAEVYNNLGLIHSRLFNKQQALQYFKICYNIRQKTAPEWLPFVMNNMGDLYYNLNENDSAIYWYKTAYNFKHPQLGKDILIHSVLLANLAIVYNEMDQNKTALNYINQAIKIRLKYETIKSPALLNFYILKACILNALQKTDEATILLDSIYQYISLIENPSLQNSFLKARAESKSTIGEFDSAQFYIDKALYSLDSNYYHKKNYSPNFPDYALISTLKLKGEIYLKHYQKDGKKENLKLAILYNQKAVECIDRYVYRQPNIISDPSVYYHLRKLISTHLNLLDELNKVDSHQVSFLELSQLFEADRMHSVKKNLIYNQLLAENQDTDHLLKKRQILNNFLMEGIKTKNQGAHQDSLLTELNQLEIELKNKMGSLYDLKIKENYSISKDYLNNLPENTALIQYFFSDSILHCLYLSDKYFNWYKIDWNTKEQELLYSALKMLKDPSNQQYNTLEFLAEKILPFLKNNPKENKFIIMPSGLLHHLPFEALIYEKEFLVKNYTISYLEALSWPMKSVPKFSNKFSGYAPFASIKPSIPNDQSNSLFRNNLKLNVLKGSKEEIQNAASYFNYELFANERATETQLKANNKNLKVIHLATHALMNDENALLNSIVLAADSINDGILHTYELFHIKLPAQLAVLSACNTGNGNYQQGEGLLSLSTGFFTAGVQNILLTLWAIPDQQSTTLMNIFYKYWQSEDYSLAEALRATKLQYLSQADELTKHPFFWSGYVMHQKELNNYDFPKSWLWEIFLGSLILFFLIYIVYRKWF